VIDSSTATGVPFERRGQSRPSGTVRGEYLGNGVELAMARAGLVPSVRRSPATIRVAAGLGVRERVGISSSRWPSL
jgi:hypothetical protein